jgi:hypothetical protein
MKRIELEKKQIKKKFVFENSDYNDQCKIINCLYLEDNNLENKKEYLNYIKLKYNNYIYQDKKNNIYSKDFFLTLEDFINKLVECKLICFYCKKKCILFHKHSYDKSQITLERIDNNKGHTNENTVIACLNCNLSRGNLNCNKFIESQKIKIIRKIT